MTDKNNHDEIGSLLNQALQFSSENNQEALLNLLRPHLELGLIPTGHNDFDRLIAYGYLLECNLIKAEEFLSIPTMSKIDIDCLFIYSQINFRLSNFNKAIEFADQYLKQYSGDAKTSRQFSDCRINKLDILNLTGKSYLNLQQFEKADEYFQLAIDFDKTSQTAYLNLIKSARYQNNNAKAVAAVEEGLLNSAITEELKLWEAELNTSIECQPQVN